MLMILINWLYIGITTFLTGYAILGLFAHLFEYKVRHVISYFLAGLVFATVYAQVFSLFAGVSVTANVILCFVCLLLFFAKKKELSVSMAEFLLKLKKEKWRLPAAFVLILLMAYGTSRGYLHFDTGLYHAQSIRWIEEYGVVPGLGNLQTRFGYNSAAFSLTALYSMKNLFDRSLHATAGYLALLASFMAMDLYRVFIGKKIRLSDFARIGLVFYLCVIFGEMMSPASDYYAMLLLFVILILWLDEDEYRTEYDDVSWVPYGLLCFLLVLAVTVKFSVAPLLLLVLKPATMLIRKKDIKNIVICLGTGFLTALPFFARNVIISGWLIYPSTILDLFNVDWKIPKEIADYDAVEIGAYGKGLNDAMLADTPIMQWLPIWFAALKPLEKIFVILTVVAIAVGLGYVVFLMIREHRFRLYDAVQKGKEHRNTIWTNLDEKQHRNNVWNRQWDFPFVFMAFAIASVFWFLSAPLIRYGYAYVVAVPLITFGFLYKKILMFPKIKPFAVKIHAGLCVLVVLFLLTRIKGLGENILRTYDRPYYVAQQDYGEYEATERLLGDIIFYVPSEQGQIGYHKFPSSLFAIPVELRGDSIEDGFRSLYK